MKSIIDHVLKPLKDTLSELLSFKFQFSFPKEVTNEFTWRGVKSAVARVFVDKLPRGYHREAV